MRSILIAAMAAALLVGGCAQSPTAHEDHPGHVEGDKAPGDHADHEGHTPGDELSATPGKAAYETGSIQVGDKGVCVVCATEDNSSEEETVAATVEYQGKTYAFCSEDEKARFLTDPARYVPGS